MPGGRRRRPRSSHLRLSSRARNLRASNTAHSAALGSHAPRDKEHHPASPKSRASTRPKGGMSVMPSLPISWPPSASRTTSAISPIRSRGDLHGRLFRPVPRSHRVPDHPSERELKGDIYHSRSPPADKGTNLGPSPLCQMTYGGGWDRWHRVRRYTGPRRPNVRPLPITSPIRKSKHPIWT